MVAMWSLAILTMFALSMGNSARSKIDFVYRLSKRHKLRLAATSGVEAAIVVLSEKEKGMLYDALVESWSINDFLGGVDLGGVEFSVEYPYSPGDYKDLEKRYGMIDEERKININTADYDIMKKLFRLAAGLGKKKADDIAAAIIDWRDKDDFPKINGAESKYYSGLKPPYNCKSSPFELVEELQLVKGITPEIYDNIRPYITVYGNGRVNINTASKTVLNALGIGRDLINKIIRFRTGMDGEEGTFDDYYFTARGAITADLNKEMALTSKESAELANLVSANKLDTISSVFTIKSVARFPCKRSVAEVVCIFDRSGLGRGKEAIKYWRERFYTESVPEE